LRVDLVIDEAIHFDDPVPQIAGFLRDTFFQ
jgi:hypothetical protein